jgi:Putative transposase
MFGSSACTLRDSFRTEERWRVGAAGKKNGSADATCLSGRTPAGSASRPPYALPPGGEAAARSERVFCRLARPAPDGSTAPSLMPLEFLQRLALLIPPPRSHQHRYHGV